MCVCVCVCVSFVLRMPCVHTALLNSYLDVGEFFADDHLPNLAIKCEHTGFARRSQAQWRIYEDDDHDVGGDKVDDVHA